MNCQRVQRRLSAFRAGQLSAWRARRIAAHLEQCAVCRAECDQLQRLDAVLGRWTAEAEPRANFEARVWNRIRAAEQERPTTIREGWLRPAWMLGAACATALAMVSITGVFTQQRADAAGRQQMFASLGLNQLDNFPAGSLTAGYLDQP